MKLVTFAKDMAPHRVGDTRLVPDDVADRLVKSGEASGATPFPPQADAPRPKPARGYLTRHG